MTQHHDLPLPDIHQLAAEMREHPSAEIMERIREVAQQTTDVYWVHAEVQQDHPDVTIRQVAWTLTR